jgi:hypothetical protein
LRNAGSNNLNKYALLYFMKYLDVQGVPVFVEAVMGLIK